MTKPKAKEPSFEEALTQLESIVDAMAELLTQFEEGTKLLKLCETRLKNAELRIEQLKQSKEGEPSFTSFETTDSIE